MKKGIVVGFAVALVLAVVVHFLLVEKAVADKAVKWRQISADTIKHSQEDWIPETGVFVQRVIKLRDDPANPKLDTYRIWIGNAGRKEFYNGGTSIDLFLAYGDKGWKKVRSWKKVDDYKKLPKLKAPEDDGRVVYTPVNFTWQKNAKFDYMRVGVQLYDKNGKRYLVERAVNDFDVPKF